MCPIPIPVPVRTHNGDGEGAYMYMGIIIDADAEPSVPPKVCPVAEVNFPRDGKAVRAPLL